MEKRYIGVVVPEFVFEELDKLRNEQGLNVSHLVRRLLIEYLQGEKNARRTTEQTVES